MARGGEPAAKARAARAYADLTLDEIASRLGWSKETWGRVERGQRTLNTDEVRAAAEACGVAVEFFAADFSRLSELEPTTPRVQLLEDRMHAIELQVAALVRAVLGPRSEAPPASGALQGG